VLLADTGQRYLLVRDLKVASLTNKSARTDDGGAA
jgi:hypothetical protein